MKMMRFKQEGFVECVNSFQINFFFKLWDFGRRFDFLWLDGKGGWS